MRKVIRKRKMVVMMGWVWKKKITVLAAKSFFPVLVLDCCCALVVILVSLNANIYKKAERWPSGFNAATCVDFTTEICPPTRLSGCACSRPRPSCNGYEEALRLYSYRILDNNSEI